MEDIYTKQFFLQLNRISIKLEDKELILFRNTNEFLVVDKKGEISEFFKGIPEKYKEIFRLYDVMQEI